MKSNNLTFFPEEILRILKGAVLKLGSRFILLNFDFFGILNNKIEIIFATSLQYVKSLE